MSDEVNEDGGEAGSSGSGGSSMVGDLGPGERLVAAGGAAAVLVFVIFELIAREYFVSTMLLVCASLVVATVWLAHNRQNIDWQLPYRWVVRVLAFVTAYVGLLESSMTYDSTISTNRRPWSVGSSSTSGAV